MWNIVYQIYSAKNTQRDTHKTRKVFGVTFWNKNVQCSFSPESLVLPKPQKKALQIRKTLFPS